MIASYPVLALFVENAGQIELGIVLRSWFVSLILAAVLVTVFRLVMRNTILAATATSLTLAVFLSYGHLYDGLKAIGLSGETLVRHRYLLPVLIGLIIVASWWLLKYKPTERVPQFMTVIGLALIVQPLVRLAAFELESASLRRSLAGHEAACSLPGAGNAQAPDIYLIIMDAYERDDILDEMHGYDNTPFIRSLQSMGFYVARGSMSNYRHTEVSLASMLNFEYVQNIPESYSPGSNNRSGIIELIKNPRLRRELECLGYSTVAFETGVVWTEWRDADYFISREAGFLYEVQFLGGLTRFESLLLKTTVARALVDLSSKLSVQEQALSNDPVTEHRERILFVFDQLHRVPELPSPKFVFVHILSPHPPMVFGRNGEYVNQADFETDPTGQRVRRSVLDAYADQVHFLNGMLLETAEAIKEKSSVPPIIIVQGDHGWADRNAEDKLSILNAYHLPGRGNELLYPTITPVNTFRHILGFYLGGDLELLEDISYFSTEERVFEFEIIPNTWSLEK